MTELKCETVRPGDVKEIHISSAPDWPAQIDAAIPEVDLNTVLVVDTEAKAGYARLRGYRLMNKLIWTEVRASAGKSEDQ